MKTFSIKGAISHGWALFKENKKILILSTILYVALSGLYKQNSFGRGYYHEGFGSPIVWLVLFALSIIVQIGWFKIMLHVEEGTGTSLKELFTHLELFWKYLGVYVLYVVIVVIGFLLFIIPGFYLMLKYGFAPFLIVDKKDLRIKEAFKQSAQMSDGVKWKLFGLCLVMILLNLLGALALGFGLLVSVPVTMLAYIHVYKELQK